MLRPRSTRGLVAIGACVVVSCTTVAAPPASADVTSSAVQIVADGCANVEIHGAGLVVGRGKVATVAHVVAGATTISVRNSRGRSDATVVYFDSVNDVAVLAVDETLAPAIPIGSASAGAAGKVIVYRDDLPLTLDVEFRRLVDIKTADIYGEGVHARPGYELGVDIEAGDSGAVVVVDGRGVALLWSRSRQSEDRAWAMRTSLIADHLGSTIPVDHGRCL